DPWGEIDSKPADRVVVPEALVFLERDQHLAALVAVLAIHAGHGEGARSRGGREREPVMWREAEPPGQGLRDEDRAACELGPRARRAPAGESHPRVTLGRESHRVYIDRAMRREDHDPAALTVSAHARRGQEGPHDL